MSKVRVQDATKELSSSVGQLYETVSKSRKRALEALNSLKKLEENARQKERELKDLPYMHVPSPADVKALLF